VVEKFLRSKSQKVIPRRYLIKTIYFIKAVVFHSFGILMSKLQSHAKTYCPGRNSI